MLVFENSGYQLLAQEYRYTVCKNFTALLNDDKKLNALFMGMPFSEAGAGLDYYCLFGYCLLLKIKNTVTK